MQDRILVSDVLKDKRAYILSWRGIKVYGELKISYKENPATYQNAFQPENQMHFGKEPCKTKNHNNL